MNTPPKAPRMIPTHIVIRPNGSNFPVHLTRDMLLRWQRLGIPVRPLPEKAKQP